MSRIPASDQPLRNYHGSYTVLWEVGLFVISPGVEDEVLDYTVSNLDMAGGVSPQIWVWQMCWHPDLGMAGVGEGSHRGWRVGSGDWA